ncbi:hypothetical protein ACUM5Y_01655 [Marinomonas dokdonensis]|uniref:hypothetical protein n=1 Tax=Marinomonas dokdonensis TaxID=328224 RepID=UPI0040554487
MELVEKKFRDVKNGHPKYILRLTNYIEYLFGKGRVHEAKYFFDILYAIKPDHIKTIKIGYDLSIAIFNNELVQIFDKKIIGLKRKSLYYEIHWFQLKYYISINNFEKSARLCNVLLSNKNDNKYLSTVFEACFSQENYDIAKNISEYVKRNRLILNQKAEKEIKKIVIKKFLNTIVRFKNA